MTQLSTRFTRGLTITTLAAAVTLAGCANMSETQTDTAKGAGLGAVAGALLGAAGCLVGTTPLRHLPLTRWRRSVADGQGTGALGFWICRGL